VGNGQFRVAERFSISVAATGVFHSSYRSSLDEPDPFSPSGTYRDVFSGGMKRTGFLSPSYAEVSAIRANCDRMQRFVPHSGGATPALICRDDENAGATILK
jgi:hypothetical protein